MSKIFNADKARDPKVLAGIMSSFGDSLSEEQLTIMVRDVISRMRREGVIVADAKMGRAIGQGLYKAFQEASDG